MSAAMWGAAEVDVTAAFVRSAADGEMRLRHQIAIDADMESANLAAPLRGQADACRNAVLVGDDGFVESSLRACRLKRGGPGMQVVQTWATSDGRSGSTRLAYLFRGHVLAVVTLASTDSSGSCRHTAFDRIVDVAAAKIDSLGQ